MMKKELKRAYVPPSIEVIEMEHEGVLAGSITGSGVSGMNHGSGAFTPTSAARRSSYNQSSPIGDLEDMINDILTVER